MEAFLNFKVFFAMLKKTFKIDMRYKVDSLSILLRPIISILPLILFSIYSASDYNTFFINTGTHNYIGYIIISFFFMSFVNNVMISASISITSELQQGTFESILIAADNTLSIWIGDILSNNLIQLLDSIILCVVVLVLFKQRVYVYSPLILIITILISTLISLGIGIMLAAITIKSKLSKIAFMSSSMLMFLAGITYPVTMFPNWLKNIAFFNPLTFCIDLIRYGMLGTITYLPLSNEIIILSIYSLILLTISMRIYIRILKNLKQTGTLSNY